MTDEVYIQNGKMFHKNGALMGHVETDVDGYKKLFLEPHGGWLDEYILYAMATALEEINRDWDTQVRTELDILETRRVVCHNSLE